VILLLEDDPKDQELINRLFRIMHTIKCSGAMFSFQKIADFAHHADFVHHLETMLDLVRTGNLSITPELTELLLQSRDQIQVMLYTSDNAVGCQLHHPMTPQPATPVPAASQSTYRLRIKLNPRVMATGIDPLSLLRELQSIGECAISAQTDQIPWLEEMDPEECYFYWDAIINTSASLADLEAIFLFVQDDARPAGKSQISITRLNDELEDETGEPLAVEQKKIGEILVERGDITREQVCQVLARQKRSGDLMVEAGIVSRGKVESALIEQEMVRQLRTPAPLATGDPLAGNQVNTGAPLAVETARINADTIRVSMKKLDRLINLAGEMAIIQEQLSKACACYQDTNLLTQVESIERLTNELHDCALNIRMLSIEPE